MPDRPPPDFAWAAGAFVAIDFETGDHGPDSAVAVGLARVEGFEVVARASVLIRPPRPHILFSYVHGITWPMVREAPPFADAWPRLAPLLAGATALVSHNAPFDQRVLAACCAAAGLAAPALPFRCTVQMSRRAWGLKPNDLASVCGRLGVPLKHHDAGSDAEACARVAIAAARLAHARG